MIAGYKGFEQNLKCRDFQYELGKTYETDATPIRCTQNGFHFCENPLDVFAYYPPGTSRYAQVEGEGQVDRTDASDSKMAVSRLHVGAEIGLHDLISAGVQFIRDRVKDDGNSVEHRNRSAATNTGHYSAATNTGEQSAATNTGHRSAATNTGNRSAATSTGNRSAATNTGHYSAATNTGHYSAATNTGYQSAATNTGHYSAATNTGYQSAATNTGNRSAATNTGDQSVASVEGMESIAVAAGYHSRAKGAFGCWIVLAEWDEDGSHIQDVQCRRVDGDHIQADTWYRLEGGRFVTEGDDD